MAPVMRLGKEWWTKKNGDDVVFEWPILTLANNQDQLPTIIIKKVKR